MEGNRIIIITGVSCSWKTTLQKWLLQKGWNKPINFTTRKPRDENALSHCDEDWDYTSKELEEYIFISNNNFLKKYKNWDFLEITNYIWDRYWVSKIIPKGNVCIVLDPIWRSQALEYFTRVGINVETYYLEISKDVQLDRLSNRGDNEKQILARKKDFDWFSYTDKCIRLNWNKSVWKLIEIIEKEIGKF